MGIRKPPADRLILAIARKHGQATLRNLAHAHIHGSVLEEARRQTAGLVEWEPTYPDGRRNRSRAARLTLPGIWRAIRLTKDYDATLVLQTLAAIEIKALLARLEAERNPLALEIARDREDAQEYRRQLAERKAALARKDREALEQLAKPKRKMSARHLVRFNNFLVSRGRPPVKSKPGPQAAEPPPAPAAFGSRLRSSYNEAPAGILPASQIRPPSAEECRKNAEAAGLLNRPHGALNQRSDVEQIRAELRSSRDAELIAQCAICDCFTAPNELRPEHHNAQTGLRCPGGGTRA